ncbi:hypothetical protein LIER_43303 [Lithospermum erythrorhizon]|uniref:Transposase MuDR plant domain-containing protein n=1 Tax=Lithospermum erythrorhizon TaxID=34254 RepID=A0AAV3PV39_LITER
MEENFEGGGSQIFGQRGERRGKWMRMEIVVCGAPGKKKYKGPYARRGIQFRERRLVGNVPNTSDDSNHALDENVDDSDFDSGNTTSDSDKDVTYKFTDEMRKKNRYVHFNEKTIKNSKLFTCLVFSSSSQFKEVMTWYSTVRRKDIWFTCNEKYRFGARCLFPCEWFVWLSRDKKLNDKDLVIKTISKNYTNCVPSKKRMLIKSSWLAKVLIDWFRLLPNMSLKVLKVAMDKKFGLMITDHQARRVKEKGLENY